MIARRLFLTLLLIAFAPDVSNAQTGQQLLGQFQDWSAYTANSGSKVCFVISQPKSRAPEGLNRDPAYFFVSHRPGDSVRNEVSIQVGFPTRAGSTMDLTIGSNTFQLVTQNERGWSNGQDDARLVEAMRAAGSVTVSSTSGRGNVTTDTYSLRGISAALDKINAECR
ncbi:invasion associated locus B family protein [Terrihabitans sp. B22-R8]|uniref:invasion associated locus B family protein n=1 Tax=Terrihabitans sp. B22-R8 TaxID=3425128 RepID=UPI00403D36EF